MANTSLSEVYDVFLMTVTDYRLIDLFNTSETDFESFLQGWLVFAISDFSICDQDLTFDPVTNMFGVVLKQENKVVLAKLMMKYWMTKAVQDITQIALHITDRDFKVASEAQNLREKSTHLNMIKEECSQLLIDYGIKRIDWGSWFNQSFQGV